MKQILLGTLTCAVLIASLIGCRKELDQDINGQVTQAAVSGFGHPVTLSVAGQVLDVAGTPLVGATVRAGFGSTSTITDAQGAFRLSGIEGRSGLGYIKVEMAGYFPGSRSFIPTTGLNMVRVALIQRTVAGTLQGSAGGTVTAQGVEVVLPADGYTRNGTAYTGTIQVAMQNLDPTSADMEDRMPGALLGTLQGTPQMLRSFGMVVVELTDASGTPVTLSAGNSATVRTTVPASLLSEAPTTIDLWHFDEELGHWISEGEATLQGNIYVATVGHFSWWNCDMPSSFIPFTGRIIKAGTQAPESGAKVILQTQNFGSGTKYTNDEGYFTGPVPAEETMTMNVFIPCSGGTELQVITQAMGPFSSAANVVAEVASSSTATLTGTVTNCEEEPVMAGYVMLNGNIHFFNNGAYSVTMCPTSAPISAFDQGTSMWSAVSNITLLPGSQSVDPLRACSEPVSSGMVTDIDGYTYPTVVIGDQEWTAKNLRTSRYANGDTIPRVVGTAWGELTTGAWSSTALAQTEEIYGKHYNWYAVSDPRNVCPAGWHAPSDDEWTQLELTLGMPLWELGMETTRGIQQNVGGKLKSLSSAWSAPNMGATNETGFSVEPGGLIWGGQISGQYYWGRFWSSTASDPDHAWLRNMDKSNGGVWRYGSLSNSDKNQGHSVRCVRD